MGTHQSQACFMNFKLSPDTSVPASVQDSKAPPTLLLQRQCSLSVFCSFHPGRSVMMKHNETDSSNTMMQTYVNMMFTSSFKSRISNKLYRYPQQTSSLLYQSYQVTFCLWIVPDIQTWLVPHLCKQLQQLSTRVTCRWEPCQDMGREPKIIQNIPKGFTVKQLELLNQ